MLAAGTHINFGSFLCDFQNRVLLEKNAEKYPCFSLISRKYPEIREKSIFYMNRGAKCADFLSKNIFSKNQEKRHEERWGSAEYTKCFA